VTKVGNNATFEQALRLRGESPISISYRPSCPTFRSRHGRYAANTVALPNDLSNPNSEKKSRARAWAGGGRHQRQHAPAPFSPGPKAMDIVASIHSIGADGKATASRWNR